MLLFLIDLRSTTEFTKGLLRYRLCNQCIKKTYHIYFQFPPLDEQSEFQEQELKVKDDNMVERLTMKDRSPFQDHSQPAKHRKWSKLQHRHKSPSCEKHNGDRLIK